MRSFCDYKRAVGYIEDRVTCDDHYAFAAWPNLQDNAVRLGGLCGEAIYPSKFNEQVPNKAKADAFWNKTIEALKLEATDANIELLSTIRRDELLENGPQDGNQVAANALYDRWMRVFKFASDDFWCQCCRYSPFRLSKAAMTNKRDEEPRFYADLAAIQLNLNTIPLDHTNESYVYLELPESDITEEERNNNRAVFVRFKLLKIKKNHEAIYSREHRMIYIPCVITNPVGGAENHKAQDKSVKNPS